MRELEDRTQVYPNEVRLAPQLLGLNLENDRIVVTSEMKLHALWAVVGNSGCFKSEEIQNENAHQLRQKKKKHALTLWRSVGHEGTAHEGIAS